MSDIIDINVGQTIEEVTINVVDNVIQVNINKITGGGGGSQTLAETLALGNVTGGENISISNGDAIVLDNGSRLKKGTTDAGNGGNKGIALKCSLDYELKWEAGRQYIMEQDGITIREVSHNFTNVPTANDDDTKGFVANSRWILDNGDVYVCTDATEGGAVWELVNNIPTLQQVTDEGNETTNSIIVESWKSKNNNNILGVYEELDTNKTATLKTQAGINNLSEWEIKPYSGVFAFESDIPDVSTLVPYTGATTNVDLGEFELKAGQLTLDTTPTGTAAVTTTRWNDSVGVSETTLKGGSVILKNGIDLVARVVNKVNPNTTLTKANYQVVRISGAQGQRLAVELAQANNDNNSADTLGIVIETIAANQEGFIMTVGQLEGINTTGSLQGETWSDGDVLYLSPTTAGRITNIKPTGATGHIVVIGYVEYSHANNGKIYVKVMNGWELDELHNVSISTPLNNQGLVYETSTDLWKNKTIIEDSITDGVTDKAPSQNAVFDALALKQNIVSGVSDTEIGYLDGVTSAIQTQLNARCQSLYNLTSQITHTGTTAKTLLLTYYIPANTFTNGDFLIFSALVTKAANIGSTTHTIEINTTNTLTGATIISTAGFNTTNFSLKFKREIALTGGNGYILNISNNTQNDQTINAIPNTMPTFSYNLAADLYLFVTCQLTNATDSITYRGVSITKN